MPSGSPATYLATAATATPANVVTVSGAFARYEAIPAAGTVVTGQPRIYLATAPVSGGTPGASKIYTATPSANRSSGTPATYVALPALATTLAPAYMMVNGVLRPVVEYIYKA